MTRIYGTSLTNKLSSIHNHRKRTADELVIDLDLMSETLLPICRAYRQISNIRRTLTGNKIVDHSDVVGASPVGATPTTSSFST